MAIAAIRLNQLMETKARILDAARDAVALSGWKDAQIALIAARAGVATGSVYRYFNSKADLYAQVLGLVSEREVAVVAAIAEAEGSASQCLVDAIYTFSIRAMRGRRLAYALIAEPCEPEIDAARLKYRAALADQIARLVRRGIASGEFIEIDANVAASCVTGAFMEALVGPLAPEAAPQFGCGKGDRASDRRPFRAHAVSQRCAGIDTRIESLRMNARAQPVAFASTETGPFATHEVRNQARPSLGFNAFDSDRALSGLVAKIAPWARDKLSALGAPCRQRIRAGSSAAGQRARTEAADP